MSRFSIGDTVYIDVEISDQMVRDFAKVSGDNNPIHIDETFAATTKYQKRIAHGMLLGALISRALVERLVGPGGIYFSQTLKFVAPVFIDEMIRVNLKITNIRDDRNIMTVETKVIKLQSGEEAVRGEAMLIFS